MASDVKSVGLSFDNAEMSRYGISISSAKARLVQSRYRRDYYGSSLHLSLRAVYEPGLMMKGGGAVLLEMTQHPSFSTPAAAVLAIVYSGHGCGRIDIAKDYYLGYTSSPLSPETVTFQMRCVDWGAGDGDRFEPLGERLTDIPVEVEGTTRQCGCELKMQASSAGIYLRDPKDPEWADAGYYLCGEVLRCDEEDLHERPHSSFRSLTATFIDDEDFQLVKRTHDLHMGWDFLEPGRRRWVVTEGISLPNMSGTPTRLVIHREGDQYDLD